MPNNLFEVNPVLRLGEFAIRRRTGEGILGDGTHRASECSVYTGIRPGPDLGDDKFYGMKDGEWVIITHKEKAIPVINDPDSPDPDGPDDTSGSGSGTDQSGD